MPYVNREEQREYQRKWVAARRAKWFAENGPCVVCGSKEDLELHHKDPKQKVSHRIWSWSWGRIKEETDKCEVRCGECHGGPHHEEMRKDVVHGTVNGYRGYDCRCKECTEAHRLHQREYVKQLNGRLV